MNSDSSSNGTSEHQTQEEFRLCEPEGQLPHEIAQASNSVKLPLTPQERKWIEDKIRRKHNSRYTILEMLFVTTIVAGFLGLRFWAPVWLLGIGLGTITLTMAIIFFHSGLESRVAKLSLATLLLVYLSVAAVAIYNEVR